MSENQERVVVRDLDIPFNRMVTLCIKWALAAIPAIIMLYFLCMAAITFDRMISHDCEHSSEIGTVPATTSSE